jgi:hypothetical protein
LTGSVSTSTAFPPCWPSTARWRCSTLTSMGAILAWFYRARSFRTAHPLSPGTGLEFGLGFSRSRGWAEAGAINSNSRRPPKRSMILSSYPWGFNSLCAPTRAFPRAGDKSWPPEARSVASLKLMPSSA